MRKGGPCRNNSEFFNTYVILHDSGIINLCRAVIILSVHFDELRLNPTLSKASMIPYKGVTCRALASIRGRT